MLSYAEVLQQNNKDSTVLYYIRKNNNNSQMSEYTLNAFKTMVDVYLANNKNGYFLKEEGHYNKRDYGRFIISRNANSDFYDFWCCVYYAGGHKMQINLDPNYTLPTEYKKTYEPNKANNNLTKTIP